LKKSGAVWQRSDSNGLRSVSGSHEVRRMSLGAVATSTIDAVLIPDRGVVLVRVCRRAIVGGLVLLGLGSRLRQRREPEHSATRVSLGLTPSTGGAVVLWRSRTCGGCRRRRMLGPPGVILRVAWEVERCLSGLRGLRRVLICRRVVRLRHRQRRKRLVGVERASVHRGIDGTQLIASASASSSVVLELRPLLRPILPALSFLGVAVQLVVDRIKPLHLETVQLIDANAAYFRPRPVDEGVVVQKLAA
jgi:hypothetical protein